MLPRTPPRGTRRSLAGSALRCFGLAPVLLAGLLPLDADLESRWPWAGGWYLPVGDSFQITTPLAGAAPYLVTRNVAPGSGGHSGADLSNRSGGGLVRAAANGLVVLAGTGEDPGGFGVHVVLAHRLADGGLVYSVYAHLERGSVLVHPGTIMAAGEALGRVGQTGRASSPHLHFEVRIPSSAGERWEKAPPIDPVAFVAARSPESARDTTWARPWLLWGESAALFSAERPADEPVTRDEWWCALAAALALDGAPHLDPARARAQLGDGGLDPGAGAGTDVMTVADAAADLGRARHLGWRLPCAPAVPDSLASAEELRLGSRDPLHATPRELPAGLPLTRAGMCLLLAGLAPEPHPSESRAGRD